MNAATDHQHLDRHPGHHRAADDHDDFGGLERDLPKLISRRSALSMGGAGVVGLLLAACGSGNSESSSTTSGAGTTGTTGATDTAATTAATTASSTTASSDASGDTVEASAGEEIPDETQGPYPADGSNGPNVLDTEGILRSDMTTSFGDYSGTADGVPITFNFTIVEADTGEALANHALYLWHCTAGGEYSLYEVTDQNYLRAMQVTDDAGQISFTSIFPGCYAGRWPHAHFEVYDDPSNATSGTEAVKTSQLALPQAQCEAVYTDDRYGNSSGNLSQLSLDSDNVFSDGWTDQLATVTGDATSGYVANLLVRI